MWAILIRQLSPNFAQKFFFRWYVLYAVCGFRNFVFQFLYRFLTLKMQNLQVFPHLNAYARQAYCLSVTHFLDETLIRWQVLHAAIGFSNFCFFIFFQQFWTLKIQHLQEPMSAPKCLWSPGFLFDCYQVLHASLLCCSYLCGNYFFLISFTRFYIDFGH